MLIRPPHKVDPEKVYDVVGKAYVDNRCIFTIKKPRQDIQEGEISIVELGREVGEDVVVFCDEEFWVVEMNLKGLHILKKKFKLSIKFGPEFPRQTFRFDVS